MGIHAIMDPGDAQDRIVFLDRDGVLNRAVVLDGRPYPPASAEALEILPGVARALTELKALGFALVVVTNQPDVARGTQRREEVERMHAALRAALPLDEILACWHDDADACECRKPKPGLLLDAMRRRGARAADCFMIGDRWRDVEAGRRAGCRTIFIDHGYRERRPDPPADKTAASLPEASEWIVEQTRSEKGADQ